MLFTANVDPRLEWPPCPGLLEGHLDFIYKVPRNDWTIDQWRQYAEFLEYHGYHKNELLIDLLIRLGETNKKLTRSQGKAKPKQTRGLLFDPPPIKKGRKSGGASSDKANKALQLKAEQADLGIRITHKEAAIMILKADGLSEWRAKSQSKTIVNAMSSIRKSQK